MRRVRHHDNDDVRFFRDLLAGLADHATCGNEFFRYRRDIMKKHAMPGSLQMARHRTTHNTQPNEADVDHLGFPSWLGIDELGFVPSEACDGSRLRLVFAADPAAISDLIKMSEQKRIVDLAGAGFVTTWIIGELNMGNTCKVLAQRRSKITFHHLHVVDVILNKEIVGSDIGDHLNGLRCPVQEEAWEVARVDGLDQQPDAFARQNVRRESQVVYQRFVELERIGITGSKPRETIELPAIERFRIIDGAPDAVPEFINPIREDSYPAMPRSPVSGRQVMQDLDQSMLLQLFA